MAWHVGTMDGGVIFTGDTRRECVDFIARTTVGPLWRHTIRPRFYEYRRRCGRGTFWIGTTDEMITEGWAPAQDCTQPTEGTP